MGNDIRERVNQAFHHVFRLSEFDKLKRGLHPWDSLKHLELLNEIESKCSIRLTVAQAVRIDSIGSAVDEVRRSMESSNV